MDGSPVGLAQRFPAMQSYDFRRLYANGFFSYFPTIRAATEGGHGAKNVWARIEPGAGERMVDHSIIRIFEMLGRLTDDPAEPERAQDNENH